MRTKSCHITTVFTLLLVLLTGCTMATTSEAQQGVTLPEVEGLALPDALHIEQFNYGDDWETVFPKNFDKRLAAARGLLQTEGEEEVFNAFFFFTQTLYRKVLEEHLEAELGLVAYDEEIRSSGIDMTPVPPEKQYYYQYCESLPMQYIYLRNNIYVERLSDKDLGVFKKHYEALDATVTPELREIVESSYKYIISYDTHSVGKRYVHYGQGGGKQMRDNALIFEIRRARNYSKYSIDELRAQGEYLFTIQEKMQEELGDKIADIPITIFWENS